MTPPPTHRPLESPEHEPVIIKVLSRSEAALLRPPSSMLDEGTPAHTPASAVTHAGRWFGFVFLFSYLMIVTSADHEEESDQPIPPIRDSVEDPRHSLSTSNEGSLRPESSHRAPYDTRLPSLSSDGEGPRQSPHPEVHRVRDDSPAAGPSISVPTPTQPTRAERPTAECPASVRVTREAIATPST